MAPTSRAECLQEAITASAHTSEDCSPCVQWKHGVLSTRVQNGAWMVMERLPETGITTVGPSQPPSVPEMSHCDKGGLDGGHV